MAGVGCEAASRRAHPLTMPAPLLSIVTPCLNRASLVAHAVESVQHQDYPRMEHVVMDGGSTDGTLEVLRRYISQ